MTARLLPSRLPPHVTPLEAVAYDVIDDVLDVLQQAESRDANAADVDEALASLAAHLAPFRVLAVAIRAEKDADKQQAADWAAALAWAGA